MTVFNAASGSNNPQPIRRTTFMRSVGLGMAVGAIAAFSAVHAEQPAATPQAGVQATPVSGTDPAKRQPGAVEVSKIDFKRGEGGAGRLILSFSGEGASPDLRTAGSKVTVNVGNAELPASLQRPLDVSDFATPVQRIDARGAGNGTLLTLSTRGNYESMAYQTGSDYIVEIVPRAADRARGAANSGKAVGATRTSGTTRAYKGRPVTFNFQDVPVRTVLQLVAEESSLNVVAADSVQGNVTLRLVNVPWDQALDIVLQAKGLDKRRNGNVIWIAPQAEIAKYEQDKEDARIALDNRVDLITEYVQINYHNAAKIYKALTEAKGIGGGQGGQGGQGTNNNDNGFLSPRGRLVADERTNTLMISDIPKKVAQMREMIRVIDRPVDQVVIEARVVIATDTFARELGARFGIAGQKDGKYFFNDTIEHNNDTIGSYVDAVTSGDSTYELTKGVMSNLGVADPAGSVALAILNAGYQLDIELSAMQEEGRGEVVSNPRVVTSNQREAVIRQGQEVGYVTIRPATGGSVPTPTVEFKDVLLELKVTPTITHDGRVFLDMNVKKDEVERFLETGIGDVPVIAKREVNTAVLVEDGQTVVVGGVYEFSDRESISKVPFLGDIPFLGNLFKKKGRSKDKAELLIMVTPKVLRVEQRG